MSIWRVTRRPKTPMLASEFLTICAAIIAVDICQLILHYVSRRNEKVMTTMSSNDEEVLSIGLV